MQPYPRYLLSNGEIVDFMCMNAENLELYHNAEKSKKLLYDRKATCWWEGNPDIEYPRRERPLFGVKIEKVIW